ncbi:DUF397 domain-containing protein [Sphaerisporangium sp. NPDC088356]|uniref:DUF397 domain-containing protein n=1 Tax=Sphaerisporangium sp. NPDC088356 TaxID=3154871 RepID=UPI0034255D9E
MTHEPRGGWRKSPHSTGGDCVEIGVLDGHQAAPRGAGGERLIAFRDSKNPKGRLYVTPGEWDAFKDWVSGRGPVRA